MAKPVNAQINLATMSGSQGSIVSTSLTPFPFHPDAIDLLLDKLTAEIVRHKVHVWTRPNDAWICRGANDQSATAKKVQGLSMFKSVSTRQVRLV